MSLHVGIKFQVGFISIILYQYLRLIQLRRPDDQLRFDTKIAKPGMNVHLPELPSKRKFSMEFLLMCYSEYLELLEPVDRKRITILKTVVGEEFCVPGSNMSKHTGICFVQYKNGIPDVPEYREAYPDLDILRPEWRFSTFVEGVLSDTIDIDVMLPETARWLESKSQWFRELKAITNAHNAEHNIDDGREGVAKGGKGFGKVQSRAKHTFDSLKNLVGDKKATPYDDLLLWLT